MASRIRLLTTRSVAFRTRPPVSQKSINPSSAPSLLQQQHRTVSDDALTKKTPVHPQTKGPNMDQLPHVTEEQAAIDKSMGEQPPDIEQGTLVQEILERDKDAQEKAPRVLKEQLNSTNKQSQSGSRSFSTSARRPATELEDASSPSPDLVQFEETRAVGLDYPDAGFGYKFGLPDIRSLGKAANFKKRYDPVVEQMTRNLMRHGKLSQAQKNMDYILDFLRTSSPPQANVTMGADRVLVSPVHGSYLPLSPVTYLTAIIDSVAPLVKIRQQKGVIGGGASLPLPVPLRIIQRRRTAIHWILTAAESRKELKLAERVAKELVGVAEGRSSAWEKRARVHKMAIGSRANIKIMASGRRAKSKSR